VAFDIELVEKNISGNIHFFWKIDGEIGHKSDFPEGFERLDDAEDWFRQSVFYEEHVFNSGSNQNARWRTIDRRSHEDRRNRVSITDRRKKPQGRRWKDQLRKMREKYKDK